MRKAFSFHTLLEELALQILESLYKIGNSGLRYQHSLSCFDSGSIAIRRGSSDHFITPDTPRQGFPNMNKPYIRGLEVRTRICYKITSVLHVIIAIVLVHRYGAVMVSLITSQERTPQIKRIRRAAEARRHVLEDSHILYSGKAAPLASTCIMSRTIHCLDTFHPVPPSIGR
jgi:hypothetical protein